MSNNILPKSDLYKITIITVSFNAEKTIKETINSVLMQENAAFEYIIKDGGSRDTTNNIVNSYRDQFSKRQIKFRHIINPDSGIYEAMNEAALLADGEYLLFLNADDQLYDSNVIDKAVGFLSNHTQCDVLYGDTIMKDGCDVSVFKGDMMLINRRMPFAHQSCFVKVSEFKKMLFNEKYRICADYDLILSLYQNGKIFLNMDTVISVYSLGGISSTQFVPKMKEHLMILAEHGFVSRYSPYIFLKMLEAYMKTFILALCPKVLLTGLKRLYKYRIKKYEEIKL